jgi:hypothetical protein
MQTREVHRYIAVWHKTDDVLIDQVSLSPEEFDTIRKMLGHESSDPMYDCYPLIDNVLTQVRRLLHGMLRTGDYEYLLEAESL